MLPTAFALSLASTTNRNRRMLTCTTRLGAMQASTPILISDVLSTLVVDPFFNGMHSYFGFSTFDEFVNAKTPGVWVDFEKGSIDEETLAYNFFKDRRPINISEFKNYLRSSYTLLPGVAPMLQALKEAQVEVHLCTNYPVWADLIEESLHLYSNYGAKWTFISGREGVRKPESAAFLRVAEKANAHPSSCILLDDSQKNCEGALNSGYLAAIQFQDAGQACLRIGELFHARNVQIKFDTQ